MNNIYCNILYFKVDKKSFIVYKLEIGKKDVNYVKKE